MNEQNKTISHGVVLQKKSKGVEEKVVLDIDFADDMAILDNSRDGILESTDRLAHYCSYAGLRINTKKTQCMAISRSASQRPNLRGDYVEGEPVEQVSNFVYLGATISRDGTLDVRIQRANSSTREDMEQQNYQGKTQTKIWDYKAAVITVLFRLSRDERINKNQQFFVQRIDNINIVVQ